MTAAKFLCRPKQVVSSEHLPQNAPDFCSRLFASRFRRTRGTTAALAESSIAMAVLGTEYHWRKPPDHLLDPLMVEHAGV
ncbi:hypothetical protein AK812_SmicGene6636 [Symbiodinium microadriaticum]|uniref:Uncharacterized protein n=1 Tax=Symbiodinium microadriaticum TaxID=2951 RepID=A0A1Q9EQT2_SYMMI|nr:hypothetical protein AK812_SmicGene6636 [Symbiodinium microadriaticum]